MVCHDNFAHFHYILRKILLTIKHIICKKHTNLPPRIKFPFDSVLIRCSSNAFFGASSEIAVGTQKHI